MKKGLIYFIAALSILELAGGCATVAHGSKQGIQFSSKPSGAKITIDGIAYGSTPKLVILKRMGRLKGEASGKKGYSVKIEMPGYHTNEITITRKVDPWVVGNIVMGGVIGLIIDATTGSMYQLTPDEVMVQFSQSGAMNVSENDGKLYVGVTMEADPNWKKIGEMTKLK